MHTLRFLILALALILPHVVVAAEASKRDDRKSIKDTLQDPDFLNAPRSLQMERLKALSGAFREAKPKIQESILDGLLLERRLLGVWHEKEGEAVYKFGKDHEFEYENELASPKSEQKIYGAWQSSVSNLCSWRKLRGNLMIHYETATCCHKAFFLGKNLILTNESRHGGVYGPCKSRVLTKKSE